MGRSVVRASVIRNQSRFDMADLHSGRLYVFFTAGGGASEKAYGVVHSLSRGKTRLSVWMTRTEIVWNEVLPERYCRIRLPTDKEKAEFYRALSAGRRRLAALENYLSEEEGLPADALSVSGNT